MNTDRHLLAIRHESESLASLADGALETPVPTCPGWTVGGVLSHLAHGFGVVARIVRDHADAEVSFEGTPPAGVAAFEEAAAELVEALTNEAPDTRAWNWSRRDETVAWWARRMAHEAAVHRWDVAAAVGSPSPVEPELAVDGVDELLSVFLPHTLAERPVDGLAGTFSVEASDTGDAWFGRLSPEASDVVRGTPAASPDARLRGTASDLVLALWGRPAPIAAEGDERIVALLT
ncbi:MAG TPA: maleylpyruvate isomerase family mycothiol-dependent enzyme [Frankiaceae bacterium]|nr:maleylpyruvate isomerase family mycothiol-dependent enzyme [Frankiaceae bacterium]